MARSDQLPPRPGCPLSCPGPAVRCRTVEQRTIAPARERRLVSVNEGGILVPAIREKPWLGDRPEMSYEGGGPPLTIVIGTGRCGSTMLSQILNLHPDGLSVSEFWNVLPHKETVRDWPVRNRAAMDNSIPTHAMTGQEFWQRITTADADMDGLFATGLPTETSASWGRFSPAAGLPAICRVLASLTDDVDALYDRLAAAVPDWAVRPATRHCRALFAELADALGCQAVVERSGASANLTPVLLREFPDARFAYLHRDGADSALSMSRHPMFRLGALRMLAQAAAPPGGTRRARGPPPRAAG